MMEAAEGLARLFKQFPLPDRRIMESRGWNLADKIVWSPHSKHKIHMAASTVPELCGLCAMGNASLLLR